MTDSQDPALAPPHLEAAHLTAQADGALERGALAEARLLYARAAEATELALRAIQDPQRLRSAYSLFVSNAAILWSRAGQPAKAEHVAFPAILADPMSPLAVRLRLALRSTWEHDALERERGVPGVPVEVRLDGGLARLGVAPLEDVVPRAQVVPALIWRAAEHAAHLAYRSRGEPTREDIKSIRTYAVPAGVGSLRLRFLVAGPAEALPGEVGLGAVLSAEAAVAEALGVVNALAENTDDFVRDNAMDIGYRTAFVRLTSTLAPGGGANSDLTHVEISGGRATRRSARFTSDFRLRVRDALKATYEQSGYELVEGEVVRLDVMKSKKAIEIGLSTSTGSRTVRASGELLETRAHQLWRQRVQIRAKRTKTKRTVLWAEEIEAIEAPV
jgi:hypothetical protein